MGGFIILLMALAMMFMVIIPYSVNILPEINVLSLETQIECKTKQIAFGVLDYKYEYYAIDVEGNIYRLGETYWNALNVSICKY